MGLFFQSFFFNALFDRFLCFRSSDLWEALDEGVGKRHVAHTEAVEDVEGSAKSTRCHSMLAKHVAKAAQPSSGPKETKTTSSANLEPVKHVATAVLVRRSLHKTTEELAAPSTTL